MTPEESKKLSKADIDAVNLWLADVDRGKWKCLEGYYKTSIECDFYGGTACAKIFTEVTSMAVPLLISWSALVIFPK